MNLALRYWNFRRFNSRATPLQKIFAFSAFLGILGLWAFGMGALLLSGMLVILVYLTYLVVWYKNN
ncbi:MAG: hypothetical protein Q8Q31_01635 [Nanoarchaeota archaeon]|nr:hypothetical protein [Nanoarchaeota archaeon]